VIIVEIKAIVKKSAVGVALLDICAICRTHTQNPGIDEIVLSLNLSKVN
jgi:hypothetical protein